MLTPKPARAKSGMRYSGTRDPSDEYQTSMKERQKLISELKKNTENIKVFCKLLTYTIISIKSWLHIYWH